MIMYHISRLIHCTSNFFSQTQIFCLKSKIQYTLLQILWQVNLFFSWSVEYFNFLTWHSIVYFIFHPLSHHLFYIPEFNTFQFHDSCEHIIQCFWWVSNNSGLSALCHDFCFSLSYLSFNVITSSLISSRFLVTRSSVNQFAKLFIGNEKLNIGSWKVKWCNYIILDSVRLI